MQLDSYLQVVAATMGFFGVILTISGVVCLQVNQRAGLLARRWSELRAREVKKLTAQKNLLVSGLTLIVLPILCLVVSQVFDFAERQVIEGHYGVAIYAGVALGTVISALIFGFTAAFSEWWNERREG